MEKELGRLQVKKRWVVKVVGCLGVVLIDTLKEREREGGGGEEMREIEKRQRQR